MARVKSNRSPEPPAQPAYFGVWLGLLALAAVGHYLLLLLDMSIANRALHVAMASLLVVVVAVLWYTSRAARER
jgi:hypothetical protein